MLAVVRRKQGCGAAKRTPQLKGSSSRRACVAKRSSASALLLQAPCADRARRSTAQLACGGGRLEGRQKPRWRTCWPPHWRSRSPGGLGAQPGKRPPARRDRAAAPAEMANQTRTAKATMLMTLTCLFGWSGRRQNSRRATTAAPMAALRDGDGLRLACPGEAARTCPQASASAGWEAVLRPPTPALLKAISRSRQSIVSCSHRRPARPRCGRPFKRRRRWRSQPPGARKSLEAMGAGQAEETSQRRAPYAAAWAAQRIIVQRLAGRGNRRSLALLRLQWVSEAPAPAKSTVWTTVPIPTQAVDLPTQPRCSANPLTKATARGAATQSPAAGMVARPGMP